MTNFISFSGANGKSLCNSCNLSGYSRSTFNIYPIELFPPIELNQIKHFSF